MSSECYRIGNFFFIVHALSVDIVKVVNICILFQNTCMIHKGLRLDFVNDIVAIYAVVYVK